MWRDAYEAAGIRDDDPPPADLVALATAADLVACSDAARAIESARRLTDREIVLSPLLRELALRCPRLGGIHLPLAAWSVAIGARRLVDALRGGSTDTERARVGEAAAWVDGLATVHASVVVVAHASFRQALAGRLERFGWRAVPGRRDWRHWSAWHYRR